MKRTGLAFLVGTALLVLLGSCAPNFASRPKVEEYVFSYLTVSAKYDGQTYQAKMDGPTWVVATDDFIFAADLVPNYVYVYTDQKGGITGGPEQIEFRIKNLRSNPFEIVWASSSIVLPNGSASRVIHEGQRYIDKDKPAAPTVVPPDAWVSDLAAPSELITWVYDKWVTLPMFNRLRAGEGITLVLALDIDGQRKYFQMRWEARRLFPQVSATGK